MHSNDHQRSNQQQQQYQFQQTDVLNEFQYTINKDLQNMLGIAVEFFAIEEIKDSIDPELYKVQKNRLILQHNLSNSIHFDQQETAKAKNLQPTLLAMKDAGKVILSKAKHELQAAIPNFAQSEACKILELYEKNNFGQTVPLNQLQNERTNVKGNFDDKVLSQIITAMQQTDQQYEEVRRKNTRMDFDDLPTIVQKTKSRYQIAQNKLSQMNNKSASKIMSKTNQIKQNQMEEEIQNQEIIYMRELQLLLAALKERKPEFIKEILNLQEKAYQRNKEQYQQQLDQLKKELPSFKDFFSLFKKFSFINALGYLPNQYIVSEKEKQLIVQQYQTASRTAKRQIISTILKIYEKPPAQLQLSYETQFEESLSSSEIYKLKNQMKSTFFNRLFEILPYKYGALAKKSNTDNEVIDITFLNQQLSLIDS